MALLTIGHSTHSLEAFLDLLTLHRVALLADIRSVPHSKRHPHFCREPLAETLSAHGIDYRHFPELGGKRACSYAEHMATLQFRQGLDRLLEAAAERVAVAMCAEADPLRCHRQFVADAAVERGVDVIHLLPGGGFRYHEPAQLALPL